MVRGYLCDDAAGPIARARWDPVFAVLGTGAPAGHALSTPLMVGLARAIYNPRPGELAGTLRDPAELCNPALTDRTAVESLLFDAFIPAAYRDDPAGRWKAQDAEKWLAFLARHLERRIVSPDLAWWQLRRAIPRTALWRSRGRGSWSGSRSGSASGMGPGSRPGSRLAVAFGVVTGVVAVDWSGVEAPARGMRISVGRATAGRRGRVHAWGRDRALGRAQVRGRDRVRGRGWVRARVRARGRIRGRARQSRRSNESPDRACA